MQPHAFRRHALVGLAAAAGLLMAGPAAWAQAGKYKEAPSLAEQVKAGKLPPVEARLPQIPLVVPVVDKVGEYGGTWRRAFLGPADANNYVRVVYDALFRFSPDGAKIEPKIAEGAEPSADFKTWTIKLRKGSKWSDGQPFTADDILFWYNDVLLNKELTPTLPGWIKSPDGTAAKVEKVDDNTVRFTYAAPATLFLTAPEEYEGGDLCFPEFGPQTYRAPTGGAVVFSCSLLHEARPVTKGRRYAFLPFLYDDAGAGLRERNLAFVEPELQSYRSGLPPETLPPASS